MPFDLLCCSFFEFLIIVAYAETRKAGHKRQYLQLTLRRGIRNISGFDGDPQESKKELIELHVYDGFTHYQ
jgi:hypothetical protein